MFFSIYLAFGLRYTNKVKTVTSELTQNIQVSKKNEFAHDYSLHVPYYSQALMNSETHIGNNKSWKESLPLFVLRRIMLFQELTRFESASRKKRGD